MHSSYGMISGILRAAVFSRFRSICVLTVIASLFDSNSFLLTGCVFI